MPDRSTDQPRYLTTKEVADLLRVKERKVYDLATAGEIPHRRIIGKLLFPASDLIEWIECGSGATAGARPAVLAGSHDPLLDWALRESGSDLAARYSGSQGGLDAFVAGRAALAGLHIPDDAGWNLGAVAARRPADAVLVGWAERARGLIVAPALKNRITSVVDLGGKRVVLRQPGAGAAAYFERLLDAAGIALTDLDTTPGYAHTESDAAAAVAAGDADVTTGIEAMARQFNLPFVPLVRERFDLLIDRRSYFTAPAQTLLAFAHTTRLADKAAAMGGYDLSGMGKVRWLSD